MVEIYEITNEIHRRITENPAIKNRFTKHIDLFCTMVEDYGQALQPYADKLEKAKKLIDKFTPEQLEKYKCPDGKIRVSVVAVCPPPKSWVHTNWDDNSFINVDMGVIYRPKEPVNPLLWFGVFVCNPSTQRSPEDDEKLMCEYVRLAIIHDYDLRYSGTPTDTPILSADYKGKWFRRNEFFEKVWFNYYQVEQNKLSQLERALNRVQTDLARTKESQPAKGATSSEKKPFYKLKTFWVIVLGALSLITYLLNISDSGTFRGIIYHFNQQFSHSQSASDPNAQTDSNAIMLPSKTNHDMSNSLPDSNLSSPESPNQ
jgi:hypothetical protein